MQASKVYELENLLVLLMSDLDANRQSPHWRAMRRHCQRITQTSANAPLEGNAPPLPKNHADNRQSPIGGQCAAIAKESHRHPPTPPLEGNAPPLPKNHADNRRRPHWRAMRRHCQRITQTFADAETTERFPPRRQRPQNYFDSVPLVDGKAPSRRGSIVVAISSARAKPLKIASAMWCGSSPYSS